MGSESGRCDEHDVDYNHLVIINGTLDRHQVLIIQETSTEITQPLLNGLPNDIECDVLIEVILCPLVSLLTEIRQTVVMLGRHVTHCVLNTDSNQRDKSNTPVNVAQIHRYSGLYFLAFILLQMVTFEVLLEGLSTPTVVHHRLHTIPHDKLHNP